MIRAGSSEGSRMVEIPACRTWVATPCRAEPGDTLILRAQGMWVDGVFGCSADGYPAGLFYALDRLPRIPDEGRYFRLMGRIVPGDVEPVSDDPAATFPIGAACRRRVTQAGRLFVFANDRDGYYWNNWGSVRFTIDRQPAGTTPPDA